MKTPKLQFKPGDRVIKGGPKEVGVIVHSWFSDEIDGMEDCYVHQHGVAAVSVRKITIRALPFRALE